MPTTSVRPFLSADLAAAASLLAARHRADRARIPVLAAALEEPAACEVLLQREMSNPYVSGVVAERGGRAIGFLLGQKMLLAPDNFASQFIPPHSIAIGIEGHAVASGEDVTAVYRDMYRIAAEGWVAAGFFTHRWAITPGDPEVAEAAVSLGFGRYLVAGTRDVTVDVPGPYFAEVEVHRAGPEDIGVVMDLSDQLMKFHARAPMWWPFVRDPAPAVRGLNLAELESGKTPYWVGYQAGRPAGMQSFLRPGFTPSTVDPDGDIYLFDGIVDESVRGGGVGSSLLRHSMRWAAENGYRTCTLHFASGNYSGGPFWLANGFTPVEYTMERHIDERIAWARG